VLPIQSCGGVRFSDLRVWRDKLEIVKKNSHLLQVAAVTTGHTTTTVGYGRCSCEAVSTNRCRRKLSLSRIVAISPRFDESANWQP